LEDGGGIGAFAILYPLFSILASGAGDKFDRAFCAFSRPFRPPVLAEWLRFAARDDFPNMPPATGLGVWAPEATNRARPTALGSRRHFAYLEWFVVKFRPSAFII
jgi:hypothetical protein